MFKRIVLSILILFMACGVVHAEEHWVYIKQADEVRDNMTGHSQKGDIVDAIPCANSVGIPQTPGYLIVKMDLTNEQRQTMLMSYTEETTIENTEIIPHITTIDLLKWEDMQKAEDYTPFIEKPNDITQQWINDGNILIDKIVLSGNALITTTNHISTTKAYRKNKIDLDKFYALPGSTSLTPKLIEKTQDTLDEYKTPEKISQIKTNLKIIVRGVCNLFILKALALAERKRYVNTASAGGDGTTNGTSGATAAYASLNVAEDTEDNDGDLVTNDVYLVIDCCGASDDTTAVNIAGFTTDSTRYIEINGDNDTGAWSDSKYILKSTSTVLGLQNTATIYLEYLQIYSYLTSNQFGTGVSIAGSSGEQTRYIDNCIIRGGGDGSTHGYACSGISENTYGTTDVTNSLIYGFNISSATDTGVSNSASVFYVYNSVICDNDRGYSGGGTITNSAFFNNTDDINSSPTITYSAGDDTEFDSGTGNIGWNGTSTDWNANFTDYSNGDFSVKDTNADIYHAGVAISGLTTDITGYTYNDPPSIGAFEYQEAGGAAFIPTITIY